MKKYFVILLMILVTLTSCGKTDVDDCEIETETFTESVYIR